MSQAPKNIYASLAVKPPSTEMEYTRLGQAGIKVSKVILGAMSYGSSDWAKWVLDEEEALPLLEHAYKVGINTWDTVIVNGLLNNATRLTSSRPTCIPMGAQRKLSQRRSKFTKSLGRMLSF